MHPELPYLIALTAIPQIGNKQARVLLAHFEHPSDIFRAKQRDLEQIEGIGPIRAASLREALDLNRAEAECRFMERNHIQPIYLTDRSYPRRLAECADAPILLYYQGTADLNPARALGIIGTRHHTPYGQQLTLQLVDTVRAAQPQIISGLALGIDTIAHRAALEHALPTIGVLGHGLDRIYPFSNRQLAEQMKEQGGLLTEFMSGVKPDRTHFPRRNRIVAGLCDAMVVVETSDQGGSMITAGFAAGYHRDVFAFPGRVTDERSHGNHQLIRHNLAALIESGHDILESMNWVEQSAKPTAIQPSLFPELPPTEQTVYDQIPATDSILIDDIYRKAGLTNSVLAATLLQLEMSGLVSQLPGKRYQRMR